MLSRFRLFSILVCLSPIAAITQSLPQDDEGNKLFEQPGRMVRLPTGNRLSLYCTGEKGPAIVLETGFGGEAYAAWHKLQPLVAKKFRTCSYDRAGYGFSELGTDLPRDIKHDVLDLQALLHVAGEEGPYVLVGHSDGGHIIGAFADRFPDEVAGLVFLDASVLIAKSPPASASTGPPMKPNAYGQRQLNQIRTCLQRAKAAHGRLIPKAGDYCLDQNQTSQLPTRMANALAVISGRPDTWKAFLSEAEQHYLVDDDRWEESLLPHRWKEIPIRVFTASVASLNDEQSAPLYGLRGSDHEGIAEAREGRKRWESLQARICDLSTMCKSYLIPTSQHLVQNVVPDRVFTAIQEVASTARMKDHSREAN